SSLFQESFSFSSFSLKEEEAEAVFKRLGVAAARGIRTRLHTTESSSTFIFRVAQTFPPQKVPTTITATSTTKRQPLSNTTTSSSITPFYVPHNTDIPVQEKKSKSKNFDIVIIPLNREGRVV